MLLIFRFLPRSTMVKQLYGDNRYRPEVSNFFKASVHSRPLMSYIATLSFHRLPLRQLWCALYRFSKSVTIEKSSYSFFIKSFRRKLSLKPSIRDRRCRRSLFRPKAGTYPPYVVFAVLKGLLISFSRTTLSRIPPNQGATPLFPLYALLLLSEPSVFTFRALYELEE